MKYVKTFEYVSNYINMYQEAYDAIYQPDMDKDELIYNIIDYIKDKGVATKFAVPYLMYDIETWLDSEKFNQYFKTKKPPF